RAAPRDAAGICAASRVDAAGLCDWPCGGDDPADYGHVLCSRGAARAPAGPTRILRHGVLDWVHDTDDRGRNMDQLYEARRSGADGTNIRGIMAPRPVFPRGNRDFSAAIVAAGPKAT